MSELKLLALSIIVPNQSKISIDIAKNAILLDYQDSCIAKGINSQVSTLIKGKIPSNTTYPLHYRLISKCKMKPSNNLYYQVGDLHFNNVVIFIIKPYKPYLTKDDLNCLRCLNKLYHEMINDIMCL